MDQTPYRTDKYIVTRTDGNPIEGRTFVIEIDKDPDAYNLLMQLVRVYNNSRPALADSLACIAADIMLDMPVFTTQEQA